MTYVELIVVLSIFAVMSTITIFNYGEFQARVDIKNLANDIALRIVEAQKAALSGQFPSLSQQVGLPLTWNPSYGVYLNPTSNNTSFVYFVDLNGNNLYEGSSCSGECVETINITRGNQISGLQVFYLGNPNGQNLSNATVSFRRPNVSAIIRSSVALGPNISHLEITVVSPKSPQATIKLYASGRVQIN